MVKNTDSISQGVADCLIRELKSRNYGAARVNVSQKEDSWDTEKIWVTKNGRDLCNINCVDSTITYSNDSDRSEIERLLNIIDNLKEQESNYTKASALETEGMQKYKIVAEYNNAILAATKTSILDFNMQKIERYEYVTGQKDLNGNGVHTGNYYGEDYEAAKEDFALRAGLIKRDKLFTEKEMIIIYSGLVKLQDIDGKFDQAKIIENIKARINSIIPDIEENVFKYQVYDLGTDDSDILEQEI